MSEEKSHFGATAIGNKIYVCGGRTDNGISNQLEMFDCENNFWIELPSMRIHRRDFGMTSMNEFLFVAGGKDGSGTKVSSVSSYSLQTNTWMEVKSMNEARHKNELVAVNDSIYAIGGYKTKTVELYNPHRNEWNFVAPTIHKHEWFSATTHLNRIYVLSSSGFEMFDPLSNTWKNLPDPNIGFGAQLVSMNDNLWVVGGGKGFFGFPSKRVL